MRNLDGELDLTPRPKPGDVDFYQLRIDYAVRADNGLPASNDHYRGDLRRVVDSVEEGRIMETITWRNVVNRAGLGEDVTETPLDFAAGFSYPFCREDSHAEFFTRVDASSFPRDMQGWNAFLLMVDAHFEFDFMRSERHGLISKLRRIGDRLTTRDSDVPFDFAWEPIIRIPGFTKRGAWSEFRALTVRNGEPCGLLAFGIGTSPFRSQMFGLDGWFESSTTFAGTMAIRLSDGALEGGEFDERVFGDRAPTVFPRYELERISESEWRS